jgi:transposase InsO family protein
MPSKQNKIFAENSSISIPDLKSDRPHVHISFDDRRQVSALFDTGAGVTMMTTRTFIKARNAGRVGEVIKDHGLRLENASTDAMAIQDVFHIKFDILDRTVEVPVIVTERLGSEMIIGNNLIRKYGLQYDGFTDEVSFSKSQPPEVAWTAASICTAEEVTLEPLNAHRTKCFLLKADGERLGPNTLFYGYVDKEPVAARTDSTGHVELFLKNCSDVSGVVPRQTKVGTADDPDLFDVVFDSDSIENEDTIAQIFSVDMTTKARRSMNITRNSNRQFLPPIPQVTRAAIANALAGLPFPERAAYTTLLESFHDIISETATDLGRSSTVIHNIHLRDKEPTYTKQFPLPHDELQLIRNNLRDWLKAGIVQPTHSLYNSPIFCVRKKEGQGLRVVLDYRKLNQKSLPDRYSIRCVDECIREVGYKGSRVFTTLDLTASFWQMNLEESARPYTAFTVPGSGQFSYQVAPMGLTGCPASFARLMDITMRGLPHVLTYIDDVLIHSPDSKSHFDHLQEALTRLRQNNLKLNIAKCTFVASQVSYLGHTLTSEGVKPGMDKTAVIRAARPPSTPKEVKSFLGLVNYFRGYVPAFSRIASPMYRLTRASSEWRSGPLPQDALHAFNKLKEALCKGPVLAYPTQTGTFHLYVDAATGSEQTGEEGGIGACLMQEQGRGGEKRVIAYVSKRLEKHERNYTVFLLEMHAACFGIEQFDTYLRGRKFCLYTDHRPFEKLNVTQTKTLNRLQQKMLEHDFEIRYIKGEENVIADYLSRTAGVACASVFSESHETIRNMQLNCPQVGPWMRAAMGDLTVPRDKLSLYQDNFQMDNRGLWYKRATRKGIQDAGELRLVAPVYLRQKLVQEAHNSIIGGHTGIFKTAERIMAEFWWPGMREDVQKHVSQCEVCQQMSNKGKQPPTPLQPLPEVRRPNQRVHIDLYGPLKAEDGKTRKFVLVITDAFTKIVRLAAIENKSASEVAQAICKNWIGIFGSPDVIYTDNGLEFCNQTLNKLCAELGINRQTTTPYHPQSNAQAETFNKTMAAYLGRVMYDANESSVHWEKYLAPLMFSHNTAVNRSTMVSPFKAMFGYDPNAPLWPEGQVYRTNEAVRQEELGDGDAHVQHQARLQQIRDGALNAQQHHRQQYTDQYNRQHKVRPAVYRQNQLVWILITASNEKNKKLAPKWRPGVVMCQTHTNTFLVHILGRRNKPYVVFNADKIKPRTEAEEEPSQDQDSGNESAGESDADEDVLYDLAQQPQPFVQPAGTSTRTRRSRPPPPFPRPEPEQRPEPTFAPPQPSIRSRNPKVAAMVAAMAVLCLEQAMAADKNKVWSLNELFAFIANAHRQGESYLMFGMDGGHQPHADEGVDFIPDFEQEAPPVDPPHVGQPPHPRQQSPSPKRQPAPTPRELLRLADYNPSGPKWAMENPVKRIQGKRSSRLMRGQAERSGPGAQ